MNRLEHLKLDDADLQRIDEIITLQTGHSLVDEAAQWRRRRNRAWLLVVLVLLVIVAAGVFFIQWLA
ncbi:MAG: hypothetical protein OEV08_08190 [Nitrospira sp.]|nr:hypothetical protein [Nitrospira sp.]